MLKQEEQRGSWEGDTEKGEANASAFPQEL